MDKRKSKREKNFSEKLLTQKDKEEGFKQKMRAAYSAMGKLGGIARAKQLAEKGFRVKSKKSKKSKISTHLRKENCDE